MLMKATAKNRNADCLGFSKLAILGPTAAVRSFAIHAAVPQIVIATLLGLFLTPATPAPGQDSSVRIRPVYGATLDGVMQSFDATGGVQLENQPEIPWDAIREIDFPHRAPSPTSMAWTLHTVAGGQLFSSSPPRFDGETVVLNSALGELALPIEQVRGWLRQTWAAQHPDTKLPESSLDEDLFIIDVDGQPQTLLGLLEATEEDTIIFSFEGETRELPIDRIQYVGMATAGLIQSNFGSLVSLTDDSRIFGQPIRWDHETLRLDLAGLSELDLPASMIKSIQIQNDRTGFLSDIDPQSAVVTGLLLPARPWRRDLTVEGRPLTLQATGATSKTQTFEKGLGIPSDGRLTFPATSFDRFLSTACLDPAKRGAGDCVIEILLDGESVFQQRLHRDSPVAEIDVELGNATQLTLHVKAGEKLDLADHVNWCDARLVKVRTP
jgi:hypothetical protein